MSGGGSNKQTSKWLFRHGLEQHSTIKDVHLYGAEVQQSVQSIVLVGEVTETDEKEDTEASCLPPSCSTFASCPPPASTQTHFLSGQSKEATIARGCSDVGLNALKEKAGASPTMVSGSDGSGGHNWSRWALPANSQLRPPYSASSSSVPARPNTHPLEE